MKIKKLTVLIVILIGLFLQACGSSSASAVNEVTTDYTPIIGYDFKSKGYFKKYIENNTKAKT